MLAIGTQAYIFVRYGSFNINRIGSGDPAGRGDFTSFWLSARALLAGTELYRTGAALVNLNPPAMSVLLAPLALLAEPRAYRLWILVSVTLVIGSVVVVARAVRLSAAPTGLAVAAVLLGAPLLATLGLGQVYAVLAALLTGAWFARRRGAHGWAGAFLGVAVALKPSLAPLLLLPLVQRRGSSAATAVLAALVTTLIGMLAAGVDDTASWIRLVLGRAPTTFFDNASLPATLLRLTSDSDWGTPLLRVPGGFGAGLVIGLALIALTLWRARGPGEPDVAIWAVAAAALLASPVTWNTYLVVLVPGIVVVLARSAAAAAPLLAVGLIGQEWPALWYGPDGTASAVPLSLYCAALLAHWAVLTWFLPRRVLNNSGRSERRPGGVLARRADAAIPLLYRRIRATPRGRRRGVAQ